MSESASTIWEAPSAIAAADRPCSAPQSAIARLDTSTASADRSDPKIWVVKTASGDIPALTNASAAETRNAPPPQLGSHTVGAPRAPQCANATSDNRVATAGGVKCDPRSRSSELRDDSNSIPTRNAGRVGSVGIGASLVIGEPKSTVDSMEWINHGERPIYTSDWVSVGLVDVEIPGHKRFEHHVVHVVDAAGTILRDSDRQVLLLWRHRVLSDTWGWEIPAGRVDAGETPEEAAIRESVEESGWEPTGIAHLASYQPVNGISDTKFHLFASSGATEVGEPTDVTESERIEWLSPERVRKEILAGNVTDGLTLTALSYALAFES